MARTPYSSIHSIIRGIVFVSAQVEVTDGKVVIHTDTAKLTATKRVKSMITRNLECTLLYLIAGGGKSSAAISDLTL